MQYSVDAAGAHVFTDSPHDFPRAERLAEKFKRPLTTGFGNDIASRAEFFSKLSEKLASIFVTGVDGGDGERSDHARAD